MILKSEICEKNHSIRPGKQGDIPTGMMSKVGGECIPSYVLLCDSRQVGAMDGSPGLIVTIKIFEPYRGMKHSEIFLGLLEELARNKGLERIETTSVSDPRMICALKRGGYLQEEDDKYYKIF